MKMTREEKLAWAVRQLTLKQAEIGRIPQKSDFDMATLSRIKAFLGPWPRALEQAGLKEAKPITPKKKKRKNSASTVRKTLTALKKQQKQKISSQENGEENK